MSRNVWGYSESEARLYCFENKAFRINYIAEHPDVEEISSQDSPVSDFRTYAVKYSMEHAIRDFISDKSPIRNF
jgi:hypothetical protein